MVVNAGPAEEIHGDSLKKKNAFSACDVSQRSFPCPGGEKASARPRSALARGGSPAAPGKRSVFPKRVNAPTIISDYFTTYRLYSLNEAFKLHLVRSLYAHFLF